MGKVVGTDPTAALLSGQPVSSFSNKQAGAELCQAQDQLGLNRVNGLIN